MARRSSVICLTVRPRYSVSRAADEPRNASTISATAAVFSGFAIALLSWGRRPGTFGAAHATRGTHRLAGRQLAFRPLRRARGPSGAFGPRPRARTTGGLRWWSVLLVVHVLVVLVVLGCWWCGC